MQAKELNVGDCDWVGRSSGENLGKWSMRNEKGSYYVRRLRNAALWYGYVNVLPSWGVMSNKMSVKSSISDDNALKLRWIVPSVPVFQRNVFNTTVISHDTLCSIRHTKFKLLNLLRIRRHLSFPSARLHVFSVSKFKGATAHLAEASDSVPLLESRLIR